MSWIQFPVYLVTTLLKSNFKISGVLGLKWALNSCCRINCVEIGMSLGEICLKYKYTCITGQINTVKGLATLFNLAVPILSLEPSLVYNLNLRPTLHPSLNMLCKIMVFVFSACKKRNRVSSSGWPFCSARVLWVFWDYHALICIWVPDAFWSGPCSQKQCNLIRWSHLLRSSIQSIAIYSKYFRLIPWKTELPGVIPSWQRDVLIEH